MLGPEIRRESNENSAMMLEINEDVIWARMCNVNLRDRLYRKKTHRKFHGFIYPRDIAIFPWRKGVPITKLHALLPLLAGRTYDQSKPISFPFNGGSKLLQYLQ